jgi:AmiR/NasT family two-component response regulator
MSYQKGARVLVVEDDPMVNEMIQGMLADLGYEVIGEALDGQQGVNMAQMLQPNVVLMDIEMPNLNGIAAAQLINQSCPAPVVMLTAYETPHLVEQASAAGVGAYLIKPPKPRELERALLIAMARFDDLMELRQLNAQLKTRNEELQAALAQVKTLSGLLPICASCKKIRDDQGYWQQLEIYLHEHADLEFSHGMCPDCVKKLYPDYYQ